MKVYYFLGQLLRPFAAIAFFVYSYVFRVPRARVIVRNEYGEVLLVQSWLSGKMWGLPGGGAKRREDAAQTAMRELEEETGVVIEKDSLELLFTLKMRGHDEIVFSTSILKNDLPTEISNKFEIKNTTWFALSELPPLEPACGEIIDKMVKIS